MGVSVSWLVRQQGLGLRVRAGRAELDREVSWAHSIELEDPTPWLSGGELVLTTGLRLPRSADARRAYILRIASARAAAVGFGVGLTHEQVPASQVEAAEEIVLPLLEVPLPTPFVAVTKAVMERLAEQQYEGVAQASRIQPRMTRAALHGGAQAVVRELTVSTKASVLFLGHDGKTRASHPPGARTPHLGMLAELRPTDQTASAVSSGPDGVVAVQQVRVGRRVHGQLVLAAERPLTAVDHLLLGHAASPIALEAEKPAQLRDEQHHVNSMFLRVLLHGSVATAAAVEHLTEAGFPVHSGVRLLALRAFLEHNGRWEAASTALGVHRHTLRGRMERVQRLLPADLNSAHVRAEMLLGLSAWQATDRRS
ncbi:PucR family transcriptional regulator [Streptomyces plumbiresistens]|uniref:PucR family transcriptional regulator n=1 Tax=Streptomyces plumbiresistens TaxID=511811 RepID=A0ABP7SKL5_9ACTN